MAGKDDTGLAGPGQCRASLWRSFAEIRGAPKEQELVGLSNERRGNRQTYRGRLHSLLGGRDRGIEVWLVSMVAAMVEMPTSWQNFRFGKEG